METSPQLVANVLTSLTPPTGPTLDVSAAEPANFPMEMVLKEEMEPTTMEPTTMAPTMEPSQATTLKVDQTTHVPTKLASAPMSHKEPVPTEPPNWFATALVLTTLMPRM